MTKAVIDTTSSLPAFKALFGSNHPVDVLGDCVRILSFVGTACHSFGHARTDLTERDFEGMGTLLRLVENTVSDCIPELQGGAVPSLIDRTPAPASDALRDVAATLAEGIIARRA